jgi:hypothetical protein
MSQPRKYSGHEETASPPRIKLGDFAASMLHSAAQRLTTRQERRRQMEAIGQPSGRQWTRPTIPGRRIKNGNGTPSWSLPASQRPPMSFGQGGIAQVFDCLPQLRSDSPGAAIALVHYVTMRQPHANQQTEHDRERAGNELTRLLTQIQPNQASLDSAEARREEMQQSSTPQGRLTASLTYWEQIYLLLVHGQPCGHDVNEITRELAQIADGLSHAHSERRQASARIMLADIYLQLREFGHADREMATALALIGQIYPNKELAQLARTVDAKTAEQVMSQHTDGSTGSLPRREGQTTTQPNKS